MHGCILRDPMELQVWDIELFYLADLVGLYSASKSGHQTSLWTPQGNLKLPYTRAVRMLLQRNSKVTDELQ